jgi:hypothetical protein
MVKRGRISMTATTGNVKGIRSMPSFHQRYLPNNKIEPGKVIAHGAFRGSWC